MGLCDDVRNECARIASNARWVAIEPAALDAVQAGPAPALNPEEHMLQGTAEDVALFTLTLGAINFGSGWFPTLRKRPGRSGSRTVAAALTEHVRAHGLWDAGRLRELDAATVARTLGQNPDHQLMDLYAQALRRLGTFLGPRAALDVIAADGSAEALASQLAASMPFFDDRGFYKRAQIVPSDLALAKVAEFRDLDNLTVFADNLVPHVLRVDGVLRYETGLAAHIDAQELLPAGEQEREIRACAVHACELIAARMGVAPRTLDAWLWNRGQEPRYKAVPRHRTRTVFY